jgi:hypothetical protein
MNWQIIITKLQLRQYSPKMKSILFNNKWQFFLLILSLAAFGLFFWVYAASPIKDPDFWWHLKTGEMMSQSGWLLESDPFSYSGDGSVSVREKQILQGYWIWQIVVYGFYAMLGFNGILLFKMLTMGLMVGVVGYEMYRQQVKLPVAIVMLTLGMILFESLFFLERPQVFSFVFATILLMLLTRVRDGGRLGWSLPLLMLLWANVHGGYIVGDLILACFVAGALFEYRHKRSLQRHILLWGALGFAASLFNPIGPPVFVELFNFYDSQMMATVTEYSSAWVLFMSGQYSVIILWCLLILYGVGCWIARRRYLPELLVVLFLTWFSITHLRNIGFVVPAMLPLVGKSVQCALTRLRWKSYILSSFVVLICLAAVLWNSENKHKGQLHEESVSSIYPKQSAEFVLSSGI